MVKKGIDENALLTAEQVSENVIYSLENKFISIENISYAMAREGALIDMVKAGNVEAFYDLAAKAALQVEAITHPNKLQHGLRHTARITPS